jgi:hypothetical protein
MKSKFFNVQATHPSGRTSRIDDVNSVSRLSHRSVDDPAPRSVNKPQNHPHHQKKSTIKLPPIEDSHAENTPLDHDSLDSRKSANTNKITAAKDERQKATKTARPRASGIKNENVATVSRPKTYNPDKYAGSDPTKEKVERREEDNEDADEGEFEVHEISQQRSLASKATKSAKSRLPKIQKAKSSAKVPPAEEEAPELVKHRVQKPDSSQRYVVVEVFIGLQPTFYGARWSLVEVSDDRILGIALYWAVSRMILSLWIAVSTLIRLLQHLIGKWMNCCAFSKTHNCCRYIV